MKLRKHKNLVLVLLHLMTFNLQSIMVASICILMDNHPWSFWFLVSMRTQIFTRTHYLKSQLKFSWMLQVTASVDEVVAVAGGHTFSRYPLISPDNGNIVGIVSLFDLLGLDGGERLANVMHRPLTVRSDQFAEKLLITMKDDPHHFAVVIDEHGASMGIITLEDILENIVGEIDTGY